MFVWPYYLEDALTRALPSLAVLDYHVQYDNHRYAHGAVVSPPPPVAHFSFHLSTYNSEKTKKGSPVRIYTNVKRSEFRPPNDKDYRYVVFLLFGA